MADDREPGENIGAAYGTAIAGDDGPPRTDGERVVDRLGELYWQKGYGGRDAFRCLVRTILSQNTSDVASQPAHDALIERFDDGELVRALVRAPREEIVETIKSAGLYNQKANVIQRAAEHIDGAFGDEASFNNFIQSAPYEEARERLLAMNGVGPKTADCVLLFSGGRSGVFPVDTHVHRIYRRLGLVPADATHEETRTILEGRVEELDRDDEQKWRDSAIPPEKCGFGHTGSIQFGREYCSARTPACLDGVDACPLSDLCERVGIDLDTEEVRDPGAVSDGETE